MLPETLKKINETIQRGKDLKECFSYFPKSSNGNEGGTVTYKSEGEVKSQNKECLVNNPEDPAERAKGYTCKEYFHTGLPCIHITWFTGHLRKDISNYIPRVFTVGAAKAIYAAKVSSFSDDLLKGIKLSPEFDGPLLPGKFMWKAETKKDDKEKSESKGEKDVKKKRRQKDKRLHSAPSDKEERSREEVAKKAMMR